MIEKLVAHSSYIRRSRVNGHEDVEEMFSIDTFGDEPLYFRESVNPVRSANHTDDRSIDPWRWLEEWTSWDSPGGDSLGAVQAL